MSHERCRTNRTSLSTTRTRRPRNTDQHALQRIGEALLLAQNRARVSTHRANQYERVLHTVLSQINLQSSDILNELRDLPRSSSHDSLLQSEMPPQARGNAYHLVPTLQHTLPTLSYGQTQQPTSRVVPLYTPAVPINARDDLWSVTKEIVMHLHVVARDVKRWTAKTPVWNPRENLPISSTFDWFYYVLRIDRSRVHTWHYVTAFILGVALGATITKQLLPTSTSVVSSLLTNPFRGITRLSRYHRRANNLSIELLEDVSYVVPIEVG